MNISRSLILSLVVLAGFGYGTEYQVNKTRSNVVKFISDAPIEQVEGITDQIDGYIVWQGDNPTENSEFYFEVNLNAVDTGIGLRNRHMRDNYLETDKYRYAKYAGQVVEYHIGSEDSIFNVIADGKINIHGIEQPLIIEGVSEKSNDQYHFQCAFKVKLQDHDIKVPQLMFMKISDTIQIELDFYLKKIQE